MTDHEHSLQRLVDGEMPPAERLNFLEEAEASPKLWREIALAFVETQRLEEDLSELFVKEPALSEPESVVPFPANPSPSRWWALAASYLVLMTSAFLAGKHLSLSPTTPQLVSEPPLKSTELADAQNSTLRLPAYEEQGIQSSVKDGWEMNWRTQVLRAQLQDGRRVVIPVSLPSPQYQGQ